MVAVLVYAIILSIINFIVNLAQKIYDLFIYNIVEISIVLIAIIAVVLLVKQRRKIKEFAGSEGLYAWLNSLELAANLGAFEGVIDDNQKKVISSWLNKKTQENRRINKRFNRKKNKHFNKAQGDLQTIQRLCWRLSRLNYKTHREDAFTLCCQVIIAAGDINSKQLQVIDGIGTLLKIEPQFYQAQRKIYTQYLTINEDSDNHDILQAFNIDPSWSEKKIIQSIAKESHKLGNRLNYVAPEQKETIKKQQSQLAQLRSYYTGEEQKTPEQEEKQTFKFPLKEQIYIKERLYKVLIFIVIISAIPAGIYYFQQGAFYKVKAKLQATASQYLTTNHSTACYLVNTQRANVRSYIPSSLNEKNVVTTIKRNTKICPEDQGYPADNSSLNKNTVWYLIRLENGKYGWISSAILLEEKT